MLGNFLKNQPDIPSILLLPYYFYLVNLNSMVGVTQALRGNVQIIWSSPRHADQAVSPGKLTSAAFHLILAAITVIVFTDTLFSVVQINE